ncbi:MAG: PLP-dependent aminotransferase family protein [Candidatus Rokuibacteriota bacterium]
MKRHFERLIDGGVLPPESKLPATRELAQTLGLNRATVATAYDMLVAEGWARAHVGQGTFAAAREISSPPTPPTVPAGGRRGSSPAGGPAERGPALVDWEGGLSRAARRLGVDHRRREGFDVAAASDPGVISFVGASPDPTLFPMDAFRLALNGVIKREGGSLLQYHPVAGYPPLRRFLATLLVRHGIEALEHEVLVVNGSQQGLDLITRALLDPGDAVALEQPTYPGAIQAFGAAQARLLPVPVGPAGLRVDLLEPLLDRHRPKLLYCQPSGQNPTGLSLDPAARRTLVELAARHRLPIVEDGFGGPADAMGAPPLRALDQHGLVIHLGTFSKILFPGLRLGWMVVPRPLVEPVLGIKQLADLHTGALLQAAVFHFCQRRRLERHARLVRAEYRRRRAVLLAALARHLPSTVGWTTPDESGFSLLLTLPEGLDSGELLSRALERGIAYTPGAFFFVGGEGTRTLRLSYASIAASRIEEGVRRLGETVREGVRRRRRHTRDLRPALPLV